MKAAEQPLNSEHGDLEDGPSAEQKQSATNGILWKVVLLVAALAGLTGVAVGVYFGTRSSDGEGDEDSPAVQPYGSPANETANANSNHLMPSRTTVYLGNGCFWHTQYDFYLVERFEPFSRKEDRNLTALVGYAGGDAEGPGGLVCYHRGPPGSDYHQLGHTETVQVALDPGKEEEQFAALLDVFFHHGFQVNSMNDMYGRLDPQDRGPAYRINIGLPGGMNGTMFPLVEAANVHGMPLLEGRGPDHDTLADFHVYIYDNDVYPFYQGEKYHQYHPNTVVGRWVPDDYLALRNSEELKHVMDASPCDDA